MINETVKYKKINEASLAMKLGFVFMIFSKYTLGALKQPQDYIYDIPFMRYVCFWKYKQDDTNPDHDRFIAGYGINLLSGFTTFYETSDERNVRMLKREFYSFCKSGMPKFKKFLQPYTIFRIVVGDVKPTSNYIQKSTLLYVDENKKVMVITRKKNKIIKPLLYIWLITHNLLRVIPDDEYLQKFYIETNQLGNYEDMKNYNNSSSRLSIILKDDNTFENLSAYEKGTFKLNIYDYLKPYLTQDEKKELFNKLMEKDDKLLSFNELLRYTEPLNKLYEVFKWKTKQNYIKFPLYKSIMYANCVHDGLGPEKSKEVTKLTTDAKYFLDSQQIKN